MDPERYTRYWSLSASEVSEGRRPSLADRLAELSVSAQLLSGLIVTLNTLNVLLLYPEFWAFTSRLIEVVMMPPDLVRQLYPQLYDASLIASSTAATVHTLLQLAYSSAKRQHMPVFRGAWKAVYSIMYAAALVSSLIAFLVTKSPFSLTTMLILSVAAPVAFSERYDRISEEVNKQLLRGHG